MKLLPILAIINQSKHTNEAVSENFNLISSWKVSTQLPTNNTLFYAISVFTTRLCEYINSKLVSTPLFHRFVNVICAVPWEFTVFPLPHEEPFIKLIDLLFIRAKVLFKINPRWGQRSKEESKNWKWKEGQRHIRSLTDPSMLDIVHRPFLNSFLKLTNICRNSTWKHFYR